MRELMTLVENLLAEELPTPDRLVDEKAITSMLYNEIEWDGFAGEQLVDQYRREHGIKGDDEDDDTGLGGGNSDESDTEDFKHWFKGWAQDRIWDAWGEFSHLFDGEGNATLYRVITAPENWDPTTRHPGIYWSWDKDAADAHWGDFSDGNFKWRMAGVINAKDVDWTSTLAMNVQPDYKDEKEIRIKDGAPVKLVGVEKLERI